MEKYHIYEEIGKGEFSQVFKGREKKKIEYVAIKRIEKSVMNKVGDLELRITLLSLFFI
jgi:serine/threonine-protein kinase ULK4